MALVPSDIRKTAEAAAKLIAKYLAMVEGGASVKDQTRPYDAAMRKVEAIAHATRMDSAEVWRQCQERAVKIRSTRAMRGPGAEY